PIYHTGHRPFDLLMNLLDKIAIRGDELGNRTLIRYCWWLDTMLYPLAKTLINRDVDILILDRNPLIEAAVYGRPYGSKIGYRLVPLLAGVPVPDIIIKIECDGKTAYRRILERLKTPGYRKRIPHLHETEKLLDEFNKAYDTAIREYISLLGERTPRLIYIDGTRELREVYKDLKACLETNSLTNNAPMLSRSPIWNGEKKGNIIGRRQKENHPWTRSPIT
ncbi:MAG: hypothetical protein J7L61_04630, partial [Thermoplasmata archaeon]|nr:hypothetical protein [Thermoplasmata archaeon]